MYIQRISADIVDAEYQRNIDGQRILMVKKIDGQRIPAGYRPHNARKLLMQNQPFTRHQRFKMGLPLLEQFFILYSASGIVNGENQLTSELNAILLAI